MSQSPDGEVSITSESDIVKARRQVRGVAQELGFGLTDVTRIVTAASELTRNIFRYAGQGTLRWKTLRNGDEVGLELVFEDRGPGIQDIEQAMETGFSSGGGLGMGLPGAKRLMDNLCVTSEPGKGTTVTARKWLRRT